MCFLTLSSFRKQQKPSPVVSCNSFVVLATKSLGQTIYDLILDVSYNYFSHQIDLVKHSGLHEKLIKLFDRVIYNSRKTL